MSIASTLLSLIESKYGRNRVKGSAGNIESPRYSGPNPASTDAVVNPLYHPDALEYGGAPPLRLEFERQGITMLDPRDLISPQQSLNPRKINRISSEFDDNDFDPVNVLHTKNGRYIIAGGNHRSVSAILVGRPKIKSFVINVE